MLTLLVCSHSYGMLCSGRLSPRRLYATTEIIFLRSRFSSISMSTYHEREHWNNYSLYLAMEKASTCLGYVLNDHVSSENLGHKSQSMCMPEIHTLLCVMMDVLVLY